MMKVDSENYVDDQIHVLDLSDKDESLDENDQNTSKQTKKKSYKDRKLEHKLNKYETILKKLEDINRVDSSQFLFVGNCGLDNNISSEFLDETFSKFGKIVDIVMPKKKSYAFVIYEDDNSSKKAIDSLQSQVITCNQTPILFYLFCVDMVPEVSYHSIDYKEIDKYPDGLIYLENYINQSYAEKIIDFIYKDDNNNNNSEIKDLKKRKVKHYGYEFRYGANDCDDNKQLNDPDNKMPTELLNDLFDKMLKDKLIDVVPDQLTVNIYEPGNGIAPHIDNVNAFNEYIISLSLISSCIMEFRQKETKKISKLYLKPNSLLVLKGDSRYKWNHSIPERKHDLIKTEKESNFIVEKRDKRISLTFRKLLTKSDKEKLKSKQIEEANNKPKVELILPSNEKEAREFEKSFVHIVYNEIADHFSHTRHSAWPGVAKFIESMNPYSLMLDIGCGNGKYLNLRKDLFCFGCDYSDQLVRICYERNFNCFVSDILSIPCKNDYFDYIICIAVLHHLSTEERRVKAINEICRTLKKAGKGLITVWAKEQKYKDKESYYISKKANKDSEESKTIKNKKTKPETSPNNSHLISDKNEMKDPLIHNYGNEFEKKDLFVAWNYNPKTTAQKSSVTSNDIQTKDDDLKQEKSKQFLRFYHVFENSELENLFRLIPNAKIIESFYEQGNWCAIFEKL